MKKDNLKIFDDFDEANTFIKTVKVNQVSIGCADSSMGGFEFRILIWYGVKK